MVDPNKKFDLVGELDIGGEKYTAVTLRRPKGREIRKLRNDQGRDPGAIGDLTTGMMVTLADLPEEIFDEMDGVDYRKIELWLTDLVGNA